MKSSAGPLSCATQSPRLPRRAVNWEDASRNHTTHLVSKACHKQSAHVNVPHSTQAEQRMGAEASKRPKCHWDYLLAEMTWLAMDFAAERTWKAGAANSMAQRCAYVTTATAFGSRAPLRGLSEGPEAMPIPVLQSDLQGGNPEELPHARCRPDSFTVVVAGSVCSGCSLACVRISSWRS